MRFLLISQEALQRARVIIGPNDSIHDLDPIEQQMELARREVDAVTGTAREAKGGVILVDLGTKEKPPC